MGNKSFLESFAKVPNAYAEYLAGDHWRAFSSRILRERMICQDCWIDNKSALRYTGQKLNVHHESYERIGCEKDEDVVLLCFRCHMKRHVSPIIEMVIKKFEMPRISEGSRQICANCGNKYGPLFYNVDESYEGLCGECQAL